MSLMPYLLGSGQPVTGNDPASAAMPDLTWPAQSPPSFDIRNHLNDPPSDSNAPPMPDPRVGQYLDAAQQLRLKAADMQPAKYPGMSIGQALVGIGGALATSNNPHAQFVAQYMPALANAVQRRFGNDEQAWQVGRQNLLDQANLLQQRAAAIQQYQTDIYKAQMGVYGQQLRGVGAAQVRAGSDTPPNSPDASPAAPQTSDPAAARVGLLQSRGIPPEAATAYLPAVSRLPDADAAAWVGNQAKADRIVTQAGSVLPSAGRPLDLGSAMFTRDSISQTAQALRSQLPALRDARLSLVAQRAAVDPASDAARNLQAGIDQYDRAIQANGVQLDRLAGASRQISDAISQRAASYVAPPTVLPPGTPQSGSNLSGQIGAVSVTPVTSPGANAVNQANDRLRYVGGHDLGQPAPGGIVNPDGAPARGIDVINRANQAVQTGRDPQTGAPISRRQVIARLAALGYTVQ